MLHAGPPPASKHLPKLLLSYKIFFFFFWWGAEAWKGIVLEKEPCALIYQEISNTLHIHGVSSLSFVAEVEDKALSKRKILKGKFNLTNLSRSKEFPT